jgi:glucose-6-phosphate dehydrogenase assembly protein OpcA
MANTLTAPKAMTATVVAVCTADRMSETASALVALRGRSGVRTIQISLGEDPQPPVRVQDEVTSIERLLPRFLNNAVASLRLSSLPSIAWWRGGEIAVLPDLGDLVDRLVLDAVDPREAWAMVPRIARSTMISDLRWTRLTRWRNLMAQFFDVPGVRESGAFSKLQITAGDAHVARLFAGWMTARLPEGRKLGVEISGTTSDAAMQSVALSGSRYRLSLEVASTSACIQTSIEEDGRALVSRIVPLGDHAPEALMAEELRVRARDVAFEEALEASAELS